MRKKRASKSTSSARGKGCPKSDEEEYEVEKILDKRILDGCNEYLLKWVNYPQESATWEKEKDLKCPELLAKFERKQAKNRNSSNGKHLVIYENGDKSDQSSSLSPSLSPKEDYDRYEFDKIIGATDEFNNEIAFLIKWKGSNRADLVPASVANVKYTQAVIKFYQQRLICPPREAMKSSSSKNSPSNDSSMGE
ncbi:chromobox protein homolog 5-like [Brevipalpus obovatus]|uniref:chromobox protein homolog 5-like n=1 Tax=Brevipalpus obovatus TaxID=246614 RepID=UPI003D9DF757